MPTAFNEGKKFGGHEYDTSTDLNYLGARYYNAKTGQFLSEDPMFWNVSKQNLENPQSLNSYSYANDNPIINIDPNGDAAMLDFSGDLPESTQMSLGHSTQKAYEDSSVVRFGINHPNVPAIVGATPLTAYAAGVAATAQALGGLSSSFLATSAGVAGVVEQGINASEDTTTSSWPGPENGRQILNGLQYSIHALQHMAPVGMSFLDQAGNEITGRGVPPSVVENAIEVGSKTSSYDSAILHTFENVTVVTNQAGNFIRSVIKLGH